LTDRRIQGLAQIIVIAIIMIGCLIILQPFLAAILFAGTLCLSTWPVYVWLRRKLGGGRTVSAVVMTLVLLLSGLFPFVMVATKLGAEVPKAIAWTQELMAAGFPEAPAWLVGLPVFGEHVNAYWQRVAASREEFVALAAHFVEPARAFLLAIGSALGEGILQLGLAVFLAFFLYRDGEGIVATLRKVAYRVSGNVAAPILTMISNTVKGVMYAIVGTALAQGLVAAIGFWIAGVPAVLLLGAATFLLSIVPFGAPLVSVGVAVWLFRNDSIGWAAFTLAWGFLLVANIDNVLKPLLISRGAAMPFVLVLLGMLGGVLAFGYIGIFLGPALLAVGYSLLRSWVGVESQASSGESTETAIKNEELRRIHCDFLGHRQV
jgi:predicted PurR-regulated permease PerM